MSAPRSVTRSAADKTGTTRFAAAGPERRGHRYVGGVDVHADSAVARPAPPLRPFITSYVGYRLAGFPAGVHRGLPSAHLTFIVSIGSGIDVIRQTDPGQAPARYRCVVSGLQPRPAFIAHDGNQEGIAIALTPLGCRAVLGLPARALWDTSVECGELVGAAGHELWERLQGTARWPARFAVCDEVLARIVDADAAVVEELRHAWQALTRGGGTAPIGQLAADVGWSRQHLARRFAAEFGPSPKLAARVIRFEQARRMLQSAPSFVTIAQVASSCGYYDQSHLDRDFAELAGCPPSAWLAEELPSFQDDPPVDVRSLPV